MDKIIGFTISKSKIDHEYDFFKKGIRLFIIKHGPYFLRIWGLNNIEKCKIGSSYYLSFPLEKSLYIRNIKINLRKEGFILVENDWLGSIPIFYNEKEKIISSLFNVCLINKKIDKIGFNNFLKSGYSVFNRTPFNEVKHLRYLSSIELGENFVVKNKVDSKVENIGNHITNTETAIAEFKKKINEIEYFSDLDLIVPTSGGFDSRLINEVIEEKSKVFSFTYGISSSQEKSYEVVNAKKLSEILNINWKMIFLNKISHHVNSWHKLFGSSAHLHGMYQIEFYSKISKLKKKGILLSGIVGDLWAGSIDFFDLKKPIDIFKLTYNHNIGLKQKLILNDEIKEFYNNKNNFSSKTQVIQVIRIKMVLLSYLMTIPEYFGFPSYSPFLDFNCAKLFLSIPQEQRKNRLWLKKYFISKGINIEDLKLKSIKSNGLDYSSILYEKYDEIDHSLFKGFVSSKLIKEINNKICKKKISKFNLFFTKINNTPKIGWVYRKLNLKFDLISIYHYYVILKSIELNLRNEH